MGLGYNQYKRPYRNTVLLPYERKVQDKLEKKIISICELYKDGMSLRQIAAIHKVSHESIRQILKNHGIITKREYKLGLPNATPIGKRRTSGGYIEVYMGKDYPGANMLGWIREHRLVIQNHIGRPLMMWEIVHHKDRNKSNNSLENLELTTITEHATCLHCPYYTFFLQNTGRQYIAKEDLTK